MQTNAETIKTSEEAGRQPRLFIAAKLDAASKSVLAGIHDRRLFGSAPSGKPSTSAAPPAVLSPSIFNQTSSNPVVFPPQVPPPIPVYDPVLFKAQAASSSPKAKKDRIMKRVRPYTLVLDAALARNIDLTIEAVKNAGPNDVIAECGTWKGGSSLAMILAQQEFFGCVKHPVWMFDSFCGLPDATVEDGKLAKDWQKNPDASINHNNCTAHLEEVLAMMQRENIDPAHYRTFKGWFNQTLGPAVGELNQRGGQLALLRLDGDWYESTRDCLYWLFPKLRKGAPCIVDDYYAWDGCALAVHEYFGQHSIPARLRPMPDLQGMFLYNKNRDTFAEL
jgi:O-methyltransferase